MPAFRFGESLPTACGTTIPISTYKSGQNPPMETEDRFDTLLNNCQDVVLSHLRPLLDHMFENSDVALLRFAEKAESNQTQALFFDAMNEVRKKRPVIEQVFFSELKRSFSNFPVSPVETGASLATMDAGRLSLVDTKQVEESVATQNAVRKLNRSILEIVFALKQRLSIVNHGTVVREKQIPAGPAWLGAAFQKAVGELEFETRIRLVIIALFDKYVLDKAHGLFEEYNERLIQAGILPNLKYEVRKNPATDVTILNPGARNGEIPDPDFGNTQDAGHTPDEMDDDLFDRICGLLSVPQAEDSQAHGQTGTVSGNVTPIRFGASGPGPGAAMPGGGRPGNGAAAGKDTSVSVTRAQSGAASVSSTEFIANIEIDETLIDRLQDTLSRERQKIFGSLDRRKIPAADNNIIELVGMLFEFMLKEESLPNTGKALLSRLHTPLLKAAILDRTFFTTSDQPARKLLNNMISAGSRWIDEQQLERGIFPGMKETVDQVLNEFHDDPGVFVGIQSDFDARIDELQRRSSVIEQRTNEAASGQEKLLTARKHARKQIQEITTGQRIDASAEEFLSQIWSDKLTFIMLRNKNGAESEEWRNAVALADRIVTSTCLPPDEAILRQRLASLDTLQTTIRDASLNLQQANKEKLLGMLFSRQRAALEGVDTGSPDTPEAGEPVEQPEHAPAGQTLETAEIAAVLARLQAVDFGTWFEFSGADAPTQRVKLSWHSTVTEKFMFVDQLGAKVAIVPSRELAESMLKGHARILKNEHKPFVNRALAAIYRVLDQRSKTTANA